MFRVAVLLGGVRHQQLLSTGRHTLRCVEVSIDKKKTAVCESQGVCGARPMTSALFRQIVGDLRDPTSFVGRESSPVRPMFAVRQHSLLQWKTLAGRQRRLNFQSSAVV